MSLLEIECILAYSTENRIRLIRIRNVYYIQASGLQTLLPWDSRGKWAYITNSRQDLCVQSDLSTSVGNMTNFGEFLVGHRETGSKLNKDILSIPGNYQCFNFCQR